MPLHLVLGVPVAITVPAGIEFLGNDDPCLGSSCWFVVGSQYCLGTSTQSMLATGVVVASFVHCFS